MPIEGEVLLRVRYAETDRMGVVYHANYLVWMEIGRVELCRSAGLRYRDMEGDGVLLTVAEVSCRYLAPVQYDEEVIVRTAIMQASSRLVRFGYEMASVAPARKVATGSSTHIFCGADLRRRQLPAKYWVVFGIDSGKPDWQETGHLLS